MFKRDERVICEATGAYTGSKVMCTDGENGIAWFSGGMCIGPERVLQDVQGMCIGVDRGCIDYAREFNADGKGRQGFFMRTWVFRSNLDLPYCDFNICCVFTDDCDHIVPAHYTFQRRLIFRQVAPLVDVTLLMDCKK